MKDAPVLDARLLASVCHDLRGPLGALGTWVHVLGSGRGDESTHTRALEAMGRAVREQSALLEQLSDLASLSSAPPLEAPSIVELGAFSRSVVAATPGAAPVELQCSSPEPRVSVEPERLRRLVAVLVTTAVKGGEPEPRALRIWTDSGNALIAFEAQGGSRPLSVAVIDALARSQGGSLEVASDGPRTTLRVRLPLV